LSPIIKPKIMLKYIPNGQRKAGRPLKRLLDQDELEDNFQKDANKLSQIITRHDLCISIKKKPAGIKGRDQVRSKTVIDNKIREQVNYFHYAGNLISYAK
jgi:hypothetical protein